jgi:uncharacterized protein (TIGR02391 family)
MATVLDFFERLVRSTASRGVVNSMQASRQSGGLLHPFELHNIHPDFPLKVKSLFDDGYGAEATFHAFKFIEKIVQKHSGNTEIGRKLMMIAFNKNNPLIKLNELENDSELDEQEGYSHIFSGAVMAVRNPGGHEIELSDDPDVCLDHLAFGTFLLRRLERSGYKTA